MCVLPPRRWTNTLTYTQIKMESSQQRGRISEFQAVLLAGGEGTRLSPLTDEVPKCLLPVGNAPLLTYQLSLLETSGFQGMWVDFDQEDFIQFFNMHVSRARRNNCRMYFHTGASLPEIH